MGERKQQIAELGAEVIVTEKPNWVEKLFGIPPLRHTHRFGSLTGAVRGKQTLAEEANDHGMKVETKIVVTGRDN